MKSTLLRCLVDDSPSVASRCCSPWPPSWQPPSPRRRPKPRSARCRSASSARSCNRTPLRSRTRRSTRQMALMARSGVESVRAIIPWSDVEPSQGVYNWRAPRPAGRHGGQPQARAARERARRSGVGAGAQGAQVLDRHPAQERGCVRRVHAGSSSCATGPRGTFWAQNPSVPKVPDPPVADLERADGALVLVTRPWGKSYTKRAEGGLQGHPQGRPRGHRGCGIVRCRRRLHPVARRERPLSRGSEALLRRDRRAPVHERAPTR